MVTSDKRELLMNVTIWSQLYCKHIAVFYDDPVPGICKSKSTNAVAHEDSIMVPKEHAMSKIIDIIEALKTLRQVIGYLLWKSRLPETSFTAI